MVNFEEFSEAARESRKRTAVSRSVVGLKEDIKVKRALGKSKSKKSFIKHSSPSKKQILKKPKAKIPSYSATKVVQQLASDAEPMVREVEQKEIVRDDRSQFFNKEMVGERKWLS